MFAAGGEFCGMPARNNAVVLSELTEIPEAAGLAGRAK
jgi:hypothetical protein